MQSKCSPTLPDAKEEHPHPLQPTTAHCLHVLVELEVKGYLHVYHVMVNQYGLYTQLFVSLWIALAFVLNIGISLGHSK